MPVSSHSWFSSVVPSTATLSTRSTSSKPTPPESKVRRHSQGGHCGTHAPSTRMVAMLVERSLPPTRSTHRATSGRRKAYLIPSLGKLAVVCLLTSSPADTSSRTNKFYYMTRFMFAFILIALFFAVCSLFLGLFALCSRIGSYLSSVLCAVALFFQTIVACLMTLVSPIQLPQLPVLTICQRRLRNWTKQLPCQWAVCIAWPNGLRVHLGLDGLPLPRHRTLLRGGRHVEG